MFSAFLAGSAVRRKTTKSILPPTYGPHNGKFALAESKRAVSNGNRELQQLLTSRHRHRFIHHQRHRGSFFQGFGNAIDVQPAARATPSKAVEHFLGLID